MTVEKFVKALTATALLWCTAVSFAADLHHLSGKVVRIIDGDTVVLEANGDRHRIRLAGIDAPERDQLWGDTSARELRRKVAGQAVVVVWKKKDRWNRLIGIIRLDGEDQNLHMIDRGLAWHFKRYQNEQAPTDREAYSAAEKAAPASRRGLWSDPDPVPPWEWRRR